MFPFRPSTQFASEYQYITPRSDASKLGIENVLKLKVNEMTETVIWIISRIYKFN
jgi:hypothetical protein